MVDWHASILFIRQLIVVRKLEAFQNHKLGLEYDVQNEEYAEYVQYTNYDKYDEYYEYASYDEYVKCT